MLRVCWSSSDGSLFCGTTRGEILKLDPRKNEHNLTPIAIISDAITGLKYFPSFDSLIVGTMHGSLFAVSPNGEVVREIYSGKGLVTDVAVGNGVIYSITVDSTPTPDLHPPDTHLLVSKIEKDKFKTEPVAVDLKGVPITCIAASDRGYALGFINGQIEYSLDNEPKVEKGHRTEAAGKKEMYSVNAIAISPERPFIASAGGDGNLIFINMQNKRGKPSKIGRKVTAIAFSPTNGVIAYAAGNDWQEGSQSYYRERTDDCIKVTVKKLTSADYS